MARATSVNYTVYPFTYATTAEDQFAKGDLETLGQAFEHHTHDGVGQGAAVAKIALTQASTVTGVTVTGASAILNNFSLTNTTVDPTDNLPWVWNRQTLAAPATTLVTPSIPAGYSQLLIVGQLRSDYGGGGSALPDKIGVRINADNTAGHYNGTYIYNDNTTGTYHADPTSNAAQATIGQCACTGTGWAGFGSFGLVIPSYANAAYSKNFHSQGSVGQYGTVANVAIAYTGAGQWNQTAAITTVTLFPVLGANWLAGSMWTVTLVP